MYDIWRNKTGEVVEQHPGPWDAVQQRINELNKQGLGVSARKSTNSHPVSTSKETKVSSQPSLLEVEKPVYIAFQSKNNMLEVLGSSFDLNMLQVQYPGARYDAA